MEFQMTDFIVCSRYYDIDTKTWDYRRKIFNCQTMAKKYGAEILRSNDRNEVMIHSKEYKIVYDNGCPVRRRIQFGQENLIIDSTKDLEKTLLNDTE